METLSDKRIENKFDRTGLYSGNDVKEFIRSIPSFLFLDVKQIETLIERAGDKLT